MSGFFERLQKRTGGVRAVRPRLRLPFETPSEPEPMEWPTPEPPSPTTAREQAEPTVPPTSLERSTEANQVVPSMDRASQPNPPVPPIKADREVRERLETTRERVHEVERIRETASESASVSASEPLPIRNVEPRQISDPTPASRQPAPTQQWSKSESVLREDRVLIERLKDQPARPMPIVPATVPSVAPKAKVEPVQSTPPTVEVRIDRLDVRAELKPSAPEPKRTPNRSPMLSLEEYLRQRNRRER